VPETFVVDGKGIIRFKWVGPISEEAARNRLEDAIKAAQAEHP
jgi:peroxiredoxin